MLELLPLRFFCCLFGLTTAFSGVCVGETIYTIGNSLTVDSLYRYTGSFDYSIQCNQNLQTIFDNPAGTCPGDTNSNAIPWNVAFAQKSYDFVTVQPFYFTTLDQDFNAISTWMTLQPNAKFVLHTGWPNAFAEPVYDQPLNPNGQFVHSKAYFDALTNRIHNAFPNRPIGNTNIIGTLESIRLDIAAGISPIASLHNFYRDPVHFEAMGQYIATNSLYFAMGRAIDDSIVVGMDPTQRNYLNAKIRANATSVPEPPAASLVFCFAVAVSWFAYRRKTLGT